MQELSTFGPYPDLRRELVEQVGIPYGTVLTYEFYDRLSGRRGLREDDLRNELLDTLRRQLDDGIAYVTVHAALTGHLLERTSADRAMRAIPESSRAGSMLQTVMRRYGVENPMAVNFSDIASQCATAGVAISLGAALRPVAIADALDAVQLAELDSQGHLTDAARSCGCAVILEGLSHGVPDDVNEYVRQAEARCGPVPVTALGPLPTDVAAGQDHVAGALGLLLGSLGGLSAVNVVTRKEHLAMPTEDDMTEAIRAARLALHVVDVIRAGRDHARDRQMSEARARLDWSAQRELALFPRLFGEAIDADSLSDGQGCTICGRRCPLETNKSRGSCETH